MPHIIYEYKSSSYNVASLGKSWHMDKSWHSNAASYASLNGSQVPEEIITCRFDARLE